MNRNKLIPVVVVVAVVAIIGIVVWLSSGGQSPFGEKWTGVAGDPINVSLDFYEAWLEARKIGTNEPFTQGLLAYEQIGPELRAKLAAFEGQITDGSEDPVLCQMTVPEGLRTMPVFQQESSAQLLVRSSDRTQSGQAVVSMEARDGLWRITDISCGNAESGPQGEHSFDRSGFLLKQVPAPLDSNYWHLVFQEAGVLGHAVPLFIDNDSVCVTKTGEERGCDDEVLKETLPARVMGEMSESGIRVKRIELVDSVTIED